MRDETVVSSPHALDRFMARFVDFEVDGGIGGDADLGAEAEANAPGEPESRAGETAAAPEASAWAPDPNEWHQLVESNRQLNDRLTQALTPAEEPLAPLDPYDENFGETLEQRLARIEQSVTQTVERVVAPIQQKQAEEQLAGWFAEEKVADSKHQEAAAILANGMLPRDEYGRPAFQPGQERQVLSGAVKYMNDLITHERQAAVDEYKQSLGQAQPDGGPVGGGAATEIVEAPTSYDQIIARYAGRNNV